jgi:hypothetical protein
MKTNSDDAIFVGQLIIFPSSFNNEHSVGGKIFKRLYGRCDDIGDGSRRFKKYERMWRFNEICIIIELHVDAFTECFYVRALFTDGVFWFRLYTRSTMNRHR